MLINIVVRLQQSPGQTTRTGKIPITTRGFLDAMEKVTSFQTVHGIIIIGSCPSRGSRPRKHI